MKLSKTANLLFNSSKRLSSTYAPKLPDKKIVDLAKEMGFNAPGWHHPANPYRHIHNPSSKWRTVLFLSIPVTVLVTIRAFYNEWLEERDVMHHRPEFREYEYLRIKNTPFPWGDGNHSLFHNPKRNATPTGYEVNDDGHHGH